MFLPKEDYLALQIYFDGELMASSATTLTLTVDYSSECLWEEVKGIC